MTYATVIMAQVSEGCKVELVAPRTDVFTHVFVSPRYLGLAHGTVCALAIALDFPAISVLDGPSLRTRVR